MIGQCPLLLRERTHSLMSEMCHQQTILVVAPTIATHHEVPTVRAERRFLRILAGQILWRGRLCACRPCCFSYIVCHGCCAGRWKTVELRSVLSQTCANC